MIDERGVRENQGIQGGLRTDGDIASGFAMAFPSVKGSTGVTVVGVVGAVVAGGSVSCGVVGLGVVGLGAASVGLGSVGSAV